MTLSILNFHGHNHPSPLEHPVLYQEYLHDLQIRIDIINLELIQPLTEPEEYVVSWDVCFACPTAYPFFGNDLGALTFTPF